MKFVNLTPHAVTVGGHVFTPSGTVARVRVEYIHTDDVDVDGADVPDTIRFVRPIFGAVEGLPAQEPLTIFIVSGMVQAAAKDRHDLVVPADLIRDGQGRVVGASALAWRA